MSATEEILEQIPEAMIEDGVKIVTVMRNNPWVLVGVSLIAGSLGAAGGYKLAQKRLKMYYEDIAKQEIEEARQYYSHLRKDGDAADPEKLLEKLHGEKVDGLTGEALAAHRRYLGEAETPAETEEELMTEEERALHEKNAVPLEREPIADPGDSQRPRPRSHHTFEGSTPVENDPFDYDAELILREAHPEKPYVISHDEFYDNEKDYEQTHLTYWQGDNVLADERDQPIPDEEGTVGEDNLTRFGHGSKDANIVFVRNDQIEVDFEITRSFGKFAEEVMGFDAGDDKEALKHSAIRRDKRRFRNWED